MYTIDFTLTGGYRLKQSTFKKMQESYLLILNSIIKHYNVPAVGNFILGGCTIEGANITAGVMYIDGELCEFAQVAGTNATKIKKQVDQEPVAFKNGTNPLVIRKTTAVVHASGVALSEFVRVKYSFNDLKDIPPGIILDPAAGSEPPLPTVLDRLTLVEAMIKPIAMGHGKMLWDTAEGDIPLGWVEDELWRGKFIVGADPTVLPGGGSANPEFSSMSSEDLVPGRTDGKKGHVMKLENLIEHDHPTNINDNSGVFGTQGFYDQANGPISPRKTGKTGSANPVAIPTLPPYQTTIIIKWVGLP